MIRSSLRHINRNMSITNVVKLHQELTQCSYSNRTLSLEEPDAYWLSFSALQEKTSSR